MWHYIDKGLLSLNLLASASPVCPGLDPCSWSPEPPSPSTSWPLGEGEGDGEGEGPPGRAKRAAPSGKAHREKGKVEFPWRTRPGKGEPTPAWLSSPGAPPACPHRVPTARSAGRPEPAVRAGGRRGPGHPPGFGLRSNALTHALTTWAAGRARQGSAPSGGSRPPARLFIYSGTAARAGILRPESAQSPTLHPPPGSSLAILSIFTTWWLLRGCDLWSPAIAPGISASQGQPVTLGLHWRTGASG